MTRSGSGMPHALVLVAGAGGCLGRAVFSSPIAARASLVATCRNSSAPIYVDLESEPASWRLPEAGDGGAALLLAAETSTAACEADPERARRVNVAATLALARQLAARGFFLVFPSTSQVFDGTRPLPAPGDAPSPITVYGQHKAEVERALLVEHPTGVAILRITKVLDANNGLIRRWTENLLRGEAVNAFGDMRMAPVSEADAAQALLTLALERTPGLFHLSASRDITYADAARTGAEVLGVDVSLVRAELCAGRGLFAPAHTALAMAGRAVDPEAAVRRAFALAGEALRGRSS